MKRRIKYILVALVLVTLFCGFKYSNREGEDLNVSEQMETLYYRGHSYICYKMKGKVYKGGLGGASIVHDPDCKCGKGNSK